MGSRVLLPIPDFIPPPPAKKPGEVIGERDGGGGGYFKQMNPSIIVVILILVIVFLVSASIHILLRFIERWRSGRAAEVEAMEAQLHHLFQHHATQETQSSLQQSLIDSLPVFSFDSVTGIRNEATDCAVCLSRFRPHDQLRLLPQCSHAFHANCVDSWLVTNSTCPLCRAEIVPGEASVKSSSAHGTSFRLELGSLSRRHDGEISITTTNTTTTPADNNSNNNSRRSYSMGSLEYVVDSNDGEVFVKTEPRHRHTFSEIEATTAPEKEESPPVSAEENGGGGGRGWSGSWLKEYVDKLTSSASSSFSSRALSFRSGAESEQSGYCFMCRSGSGV